MKSIDAFEITLKNAKKSIKTDAKTLLRKLGTANKRTMIN